MRATRLAGRRGGRAAGGPGRLFAAAWVAVAASAALAVRQPAEAPGEWRGPDLDEYAARSIARVALLDIRAGVDPGAAEHRIVSLVLASALHFAPGDEAILRQRTEAAWRAGDEATTIELTRELFRLDPRDTVALLRLISARVGERQTSEERLALYERFLGEEGRAIPPEVRSRLAVDAALLLRERGDVEGFARRLGEATSLDPTNKEAAALASHFIAGRTTEPRDRLDALLNLLYADPLDPNVHLSIARLLADEWAFEQARRFDALAAKLLTAARGDITDAEYLQQLALVWHTDGPAEVVRMLNLDLGKDRNRAAIAIRQAEAENAPRADLPDPKDVTLAAPYERLRLLAAAAVGDEATAANASRGLEIIARAEIKRLDESAPAEARAAEQRRLLVTVAATRLWAGVDTEGARAVVEELNAAGLLADPALPEAAAIAALTALRDSRPEEAVRLAEPAAARLDLAAAALGLALEALGRVPEATSHYARVVEDGPLTLAGAWARGRMKALCGPCADPPAAASVHTAARMVPETLDEMVSNPYAFMALSVEVPDISPPPLLRYPVRATLRNISPFPLAVGSDRVLNSRLLFAPTATVSVERLTGGTPEVVDIDRRLRLMPRESLTVTVYPDLWSVGIALESSCAYITTVRWRVIQGVVLSDAGVYGPGPMCLATDTPTVRRGVLPQARLNPEEMAAAFRQAAEPDLPALVAGVRARLLGPRESESAAPDPAAVALVAQAAAERYPTLGKAARAVLVAGLPHNRMARGMDAFDEALRSEADPDLLAVVLLTRPADAADPLLASAAASSDPRVAELAALLTERLKTPAETYSRRRTLESLGGAAPQEERP